ncbi:MAG: TrkA family potassium uptake protein [Thermodesulfobacteriota bacterium]
MKHERYIVIVGCGRLGSLLANRLSRQGNSVVVIDRDEGTFENLSVDFSGFRIHGDATHMAVLKSSKMGRADVVLTTTREDNINLMVAQVARKVFGVSCVIARIFDPKRERVYAHLGIDTVCPTTAAADMFLRNMDGIMIV